MCRQSVDILADKDRARFGQLWENIPDLRPLLEGTGDPPIIIKSWAFAHANLPRSARWFPNRDEAGDSNDRANTGKAASPPAHSGGETMSIKIEKMVFANLRGTPILFSEHLSFALQERDRGPD